VRSSGDSALVNQRSTRHRDVIEISSCAFDPEISIHIRFNFDRLRASFSCPGSNNETHKLTLEQFIRNHMTR